MLFLGLFCISLLVDWTRAHTGSRAEREQAAPIHEGEMGTEELACCRGVYTVHRQDTEAEHLVLAS